MEQRKKNKLIKKLRNISMCKMEIKDACYSSKDFTTGKCFAKLVPTDELIEFIERRIDSKQDVIDSQKEYIKELVEENEFKNELLEIYKRAMQS